MSSALAYADAFEGPEDPIWRSLFVSLGSNGDNTVNAYTTFSGLSGTGFAAHVWDLGGTGAVAFGHPDWRDGKIWARTLYNPTSAGATPVPGVGWHVAGPKSAPTSWVIGMINSGGMNVWKNISGAITNQGGVSFTVVNNTWYWIMVQSVGTLFTVTVYADSAGAIGAQLATFSVTIADPEVAQGCASIQNVNTFNATTRWGGNFPNTILVQGPVPLGWTFGQGTGEPSWGWSASKSFAGSKSLSIYNAHSSAQAWWQSPLLPFVANPYTEVVQGWGLTGSAPANFYADIEFGGGSPNMPTDSAWHQMSATHSPGAGYHVELIAYGAGLYYYDNLAVYAGGLPPSTQPTLAQVAGRQIALVGGRARPDGQGALANVDLNDLVNTRMSDFQGDDTNKQLSLAQLLYRSRFSYTGDDRGPYPISLPMSYTEDATHFLGGLEGVLDQAGEQLLTFDNVTAVAARYKGLSSRKAIKSKAPAVWGFNLDLIAQPYFADLVASTLVPLTLTVDGGQYFYIPYAGSVWAEPVWTLVIPASNGVAINSFQLQNTMKKQALTVNFQSVAAIPASTARTVTIDCAAMLATDNLGNSFDVIGSFPMLFGPVGQFNPFLAVVTPASGSSAGLTLACSHNPRYLI